MLSAFISLLSYSEIWMNHSWKSVPPNTYMFVSHKGKEEEKCWKTKSFVGLGAAAVWAAKCGLATCHLAVRAPTWQGVVYLALIPPPPPVSPITSLLLPLGPGGGGGGGVTDSLGLGTDCEICRPPILGF